MNLYRCFFSLFLQFNFVGRILGPRGLTAKELEKQTGCKIMIRGKGSMRDKNKVRTKLHIVENHLPIRTVLCGGGVAFYHDS